MAISKTVMTPHGIEVQNAYHRVEGLTFESKNKLKFQVRASVDGTKSHFLDANYVCDYDIQGDNPIRQAYKHLKTLEEFSGAVDC
jgi:hypothetical protein